MRIHLDLLGGIAGDMFVAAMLDAFPDRHELVLSAVGQMFPHQDVRCTVEPYHDAVLAGRRFRVEQTGGVSAALHSPAHEHDAHDRQYRHGHSVHHGGHAHWRDVQGRLTDRLPGNIAHHATGIFQLLADAEGRVHGVPADAVQFHEVGAWDSIADIVGAACLIDALDAHWTVSAVPLGGGRVRTAHGMMPVPAPATALLLEGFTMLDDGIAGERVTPTGAAILRYLCYSSLERRRPPASKLIGTGIGFGTRELAGISNCMRALVMDDSAAPPRAGSHRQLAVIEFEVDDQTAEDLAMGLTHLRAHPAIYDVVQAPVFGKKGRMATSVRLLASPDGIDAVLEACFRETSTIGLRYHVVNGAALPRQMKDVVVDGERIRVKCVERPGGSTAKAESDDVMLQPDHARRVRIRAQAALDADSADSAEGTD